MTEDSLVTKNRAPVRWKEIEIPVRGCKISLDKIKTIYRELSDINRSFGEKMIANLDRDTNMSDDEWENHKSWLLDDAFCLTISINGQKDQQLYAETVDIFDDPYLPFPLETIFFTNVNSYRRHASGELPTNQVSVYLDFGKPDIVDPKAVVSAATPNAGHVAVKAEDIAFYNAIQKSVEQSLTSHRTWYSPIHRNLSYDLGLLLVILPAAFYFSAYFMDQIIPADSNHMIYRWPLFMYFVFLSFIVYRMFTSYLKWAFPVNVLVENKDKAHFHRLFLGGIITWLFYQFANTVYHLIVG